MESISHATVYFLRDKVFDVVRVSDIFSWNEDLFNVKWKKSGGNGKLRPGGRKGHSCPSCFFEGGDGKDLSALCRTTGEKMEFRKNTGQISSLPGWKKKEIDTS